METEKEWTFINNELRYQNTSTHIYKDEWHIGLFLNSTNGKWTWVNGKPLTINKWQPNKPDNHHFKNFVYVLIAKEYPSGYYGLFNNIKSIIKRAWICEEESG